MESLQLLFTSYGAHGRGLGGRREGGLFKEFLADLSNAAFHPG